MSNWDISKIGVSDLIRIGKTDTAKVEPFSTVDSEAINRAFKKLTGQDFQPREATQEEINAKNQLNGKSSSIGMKYSEAEKIIEEIRNDFPEAFSEIMEEQKQPENFDIYYPPRRAKKFDPNKLPPEVREKYQDAIATKKEIENNNKALKEKAGILVKDTPKDLPLTVENTFYRDDKNCDGGIHRNTPLNASQITPRQQKARAKMNDKVSSTGIKYVEAQKTLSEIKDKYENNEKYQSEFPQKQNPNLGVYKMPVKKFDPYKLPEPDKTRYFEALKAAVEIEETNSALMAQTGWTNTPQAEMPNPNKFIKL